MIKEIISLIGYLIVVPVVRVILGYLAGTAFIVMLSASRHRDAHDMAYIALIMLIICFFLSVLVPMIFTHRAIVKKWSKYLDKFFKSKFYTFLVLIIFILLHTKVNVLHRVETTNNIFIEFFIGILSIIEAFWVPSYYFAYPVILWHQIADLIKKKKNVKNNEQASADE